MRLAFLLFLGSCSAFAGFFEREPQVIINSTVTEAGLRVAQASPSAPVYYEGVSLGYSDFGRTMGGVKPPPEKQIHLLLAKMLRQQGFIPFSKKHPATQAIVINWGTYFQNSGPALQANSSLLAFMGGDKLGLMWEGESINIGNSASFLRRKSRDGFADLLVECSYGSMYLVSVKAYDIEALRQRKYVLLWETRIACPSVGLDLAETLPTMIIAAAPSLGKNSDKPTWFAPTDKAGTVTVGTPDLIQFEP